MWLFSIPKGEICCWEGIGFKTPRR
jgi:hypothetical protein